MQSLLDNIDQSRIPVHVAIIMDGNGRWAQARGSERSQGHIEGVNSVRSTIEAASKIGVKYLTLYAFSTENWNRPKEEVDILLHLIVTEIAKETDNLILNNVSLNAIGDIERLPDLSQQSLSDCIDATSHCTGLKVNLAISYSSRWEITRAAKLIAQQVLDGVISADQITDNVVASNLTTADMPDPDLLIRTGGDTRISNFLLWQIAYSELYFTPIFWPDFGEDEFFHAIIDYQQRERRFGLTSHQINQPL